MLLNDGGCVGGAVVWQNTGHASPHTYAKVRQAIDFSNFPRDIICALAVLRTRGHKLRHGQPLFSFCRTASVV